MCGILFVRSAKVTKENFERSLDLFNYRGPDASHVSTQGQFFLGHNRLSILDLNAHADQPFWSKSRKHVIVYNGEIYNYLELQKKYDISLTTHCDTELLLELYEKIGEKILSELNGMFAFVILNVETNEYFVARDRLGIKPLYFFEDATNDVIAFSSEPSALLNLFDCYEFDQVGLRQYKKLRTFFNGHTFYKAIKTFPSGYCMVKNRLKQYWELPYEPGKPAPSDDELQELIYSAVKLRRRADVPVGSYLSGGLDSTIIAGLADELDTWTVGFDGFNEFKWSTLAAKKFGSDHHCIEVTNDQFLETAKQMIAVRKEPLSVPNEVLLYLMTKSVKSKNTVVLSGEGADELFFGYDRIFRWANEVKTFSLEGFDSHYAYSDVKDDEILDYVLSPYRKSGYSMLDVVSHFFQVGHLHGLLRRLDFSTMLCSVEARVPFVDHRLVERLAGVSFEYKMQEGVVKSPLKRVFSELIPSEVANRKKVGFPVPLARIFNCAEDRKEAFDRWFEFNIDYLNRVVN